MTVISDTEPVIFTFAAYLLLMLIIGGWAYNRTHNLADYILGGRRLGPWPTAQSAGASDMSDWLLLGLPGYAFAASILAILLVILLTLSPNPQVVARHQELAEQVRDDG